MRTSSAIKPAVYALGFTLAALIGQSGVGAARAQETLRMSHVWPANHYIQTELLDPFMAGVRDRVGDEIEFQNYPASQLGKDIPGLVQTDLVDIGVFTTAGHVDKFPLSSISELPLSAATACEGSQKMDTLALPGGLLDQMEWAPQGLRVLSSHMLAPYQLYLRGGMKTAGDIAGKKVWASGPTADITLRSMGAVPIYVPSPELYDTTSRGTIDGFILANTSVVQYELAPLINASVADLTFGAGTFYLTIKQDDWDELSPAAQAALSEEAQKAGKSFCAYVDQRNENDKAAIAAMDGFVVHKLDDAERLAFEEKLRGVGELWASTFDKSGLQASKVLEAYRSAATQ